MIISIILFCVEVMKYWIALSISTQVKIKRKWYAIVVGAIYIVILKTNELELVEEHLIMYVAVMITLFLTSKIIRRKKAFFLLGGIFLLLCIEEIITIPVRMIIDYVASEKQADMEYLLASIITLCIVLGVKKGIEKKRFWEKEIVKNLLEKSIAPTMFIMGISLLFTITTLSYLKQDIQNARVLIWIDCIRVVAFFSILFLGLLIFYIQNKNARLAETIISERKLQEAQVHYYKVLIDREKETRMYRHDMHNHFICMQELLKTEEYEKLNNYILDIQKNIAMIQTKVYSVGNEILDAILNYYLLQLEESVFIEVKGKCGGDLSISNVDLCSIFANLLENAVEELQRITCDIKKIQIEFLQGKVYLQIAIKNTTDKENSTEETIIKSSKRDRENHGLGIRNVKENLLKNNATFSMQIKDGEFLTNIIIH